MLMLFVQESWCQRHQVFSQLGHILWFEASSVLGNMVQSCQHSIHHVHQRICIAPYCHSIVSLQSVDDARGQPIFAIYWFSILKFFAFARVAQFP